MGKPHAVAVPFPAQGHVLPLMELSRRLIDRGFRVTLVCTEFDCARMNMAALRPGSEQGICLATVPDQGLEDDDDRGDAGKLCKFILGAGFQKSFEELLRKIEECEEDKVSCVIADLCVGAALRVAKEMGIPRVGFWSSSLGLLALCLHVPNLIESGTMDINGETASLQNQTIRLSPTMPEMSASYFPWSCFTDPMTRKLAFQIMYEAHLNLTLVDEILCNSFPGIEAPALDLIPRAIPIGPLLSKNTTTRSLGHFWAEDSSCLTWLDQQEHRSVIYVAFGSFTILNETQFRELATGLDQTGFPFLWVVRPNLTKTPFFEYPEDFSAKLATNRGKIVSWAPQQKVLSHPAVACFVSHCGWNSTTEGLSNGVPFLCWPYFADQFLNQKYICEVWRIGFELEANENGIITRQEIQRKVRDVLCDEGIKRRVGKMKEMVEGVSTRTSMQNLDDFVERIIGI